MAISVDGATVEALTSRNQRIIWDAATGELLDEEDAQSNDDRVAYQGLYKIDIPDPALAALQHDKPDTAACSNSCSATSSPSNMPIRRKSRQFK